MDLRGKLGLLIDDVADMRTTLRIQLADAGLDRCDMVRNIKEAVAKLSARRYDLVVCDYNLGQGANGQQLLELIRRNKLLPLTSAFLMITGETGYEQVATAAEFTPDDYLLKPFTSDILGARLSRILDKKEALSPIFKHMGTRGDKTLAVAACDQLLAEQPRYASDIQRLKGELLLTLNRVDDALALYEGILQQRATPWAAVGKARALAARGNNSEAQTQLKQALEAYPNYLAAYDSLVDLLEKTDATAAQEVVEQALKVAPSTRRQRQLGALALENRDFSRAEEAYGLAVEKDRTGFFKSFNDYAGLAQSRAEQGKTEEALAAVKDMGVHFSRSPELAAHQAAAEAQVQLRAGNTGAAQAALEKALAVQKDSNLAPETALAVAKACFSSGRAEDAKAIIQAVAEDHHENDAVLTQALAVFSAAGMKDEGAAFLETTRKRMIKLNNDAVALAKAGELDQAVTMLSEAAERLTNNCQVAVNAALAILMTAEKHGATPERFAQALRYILQARRANPDHPRLLDVIEFYRRLAPPGTPPVPEE